MVFRSKERQIKMYPTYDAFLEGELGHNIVDYHLLYNQNEEDFEYFDFGFIDYEEQSMKEIARILISMSFFVCFLMYLLF